ncbi:MAG: hypothetical protein ACLS4S_12190 [Bacteroides nordii]
MKKKKLYNLFFISLLLLFTGCNSPKPTFKDLVGTWVSEDGAKIILRDDSTCILKNIPAQYVNRYTDTDFFSNTGKWYLEKNDLGYDGYNIRIGHERLLYITLYISGEGLFNNTPPWFLFDYIGDPDELNLYKFTKIK